MATTTCPSCGAPLNEDEVHEGRCGVCLEKLPSRIRTRPIFQDEDEAEPASERRRLREWDEDYPDIRKGGHWSGVHAGLGLLNVGLIINLILQGVGILPNILLQMPQMQNAALVLQMLVGSGQLATGVILLVGMIRAVLAPRESGLRALGVWSLVLTLVSGGMLVVGFVGVLVVAALAGMREPSPEEVILISLPICLGLVLAFVATLLFFLYLRGVARHFGDNSLGGGFIAYFIVSMLLLVAAVFGALMLVFYLAWAPVNEALWVSVLVGGALVVVGLGLTIWLIVMFRRLRKLIAGEQPSRVEGGTSATRDYPLEE